jgi:DNA topoisomerase-1
MGRDHDDLPLTHPVVARRSATRAGLKYVSDQSPGIRRVRKGKGFAYVSARGKPVTDDATLGRIRSLAIPPAWADVWICPDPNGHLQATGRDDRGRKQARYHPRWREVRDEAKYDKVIDFAEALPALRRTLRRHMRLPGLPREKVLAAVVLLMQKTLVRVGNEEYARANKSYGLTTMLDRHVKVKGRTIQLNFVGKSGVRHELDAEGPRLARIVKKCQDLPGQELFAYVDADGKVRDVKSDDVNAYLREVTGRPFTAKDFRTWAGTVLAAQALAEFEKVDTKAQAKKNVVQAIERVAERLGNTKAVCRKCYVHPAILNSYLDSGTVATVKRKAEAELRRVGHLPPEEAAVVALLRSTLKTKAEPGAKRRAA